MTAPKRKGRRGKRVTVSAGPADLVAVGERIKALRISLRMSQEQLAGDAYSAAYISHIEHGKREPSNEALGYIADRLGMDVHELWSGRAVGWALEMAEDLRTEGLPQEAYTLLERTLTNLERDGQVQPHVLAVLYRELGLAESRHDAVAAEKHLRQATEIAERERVPAVDAARSHAALAEFLKDQGDTEAALEAYHRATELLLDHFPSVG